MKRLNLDTSHLKEWNCESAESIAESQKLFLRRCLTPSSYAMDRQDHTQMLVDMVRFEFF